ncbi:hypothetical protein JCM10908_003774 [Rhodotorula pacifica]|uniref:uncharacterized protein n=1 Tax=Rhodotorula pacifica TaxID=1495444 RepID=UPI0031748DC9
MSTVDEDGAAADSSSADPGTHFLRSSGHASASEDEVQLLSHTDKYDRNRRQPARPRLLGFFRPSSRRTATLAAIALVVLFLSLVSWEGITSPKYALYSGAKGVYATTKREECDPYTQTGVLRIDLDDLSGNRWEPILAKDCQPRDYLSALRNNSPNDLPGLDFLRDRVILLFGDSIDRGFLEHFCRIFVHGQYENIGPGHILDPPLPEGREHAPPGYTSDRGDTDWVGNPMGRPSLCYLPRLNTYFLNVFQFGLYPEDETVIHFTHFLPPGGFEDRFDTFVVPILEYLAEERILKRAKAEEEAAAASPPRKLPALRRPISAAPDLITLTSTFWNLMRHPSDDSPDGSPSGPEGGDGKNSTKPPWVEKLGHWAPPIRERQDWWEQRVQSAVRHVGRAWGGAASGTLIAWRTLHMATNVGSWPLNKQYAQNEIAHRVVQVLQAEGRAAETPSNWSNWQEQVFPTLGDTWDRVDREVVLQAGLGDRLRVLDWGKLFFSQEVKHTSDGIHPHPPGCWVYWNMLFDVFRRHVESQV